MSRVSLSIFPFLILMTFFGCIEEMNVFKGTSESLVIDGTITDKPGPHIVKLAMSRQYNASPNYTKVEGATVVIQDDQGESETLSYVGRGEYATSEDFAVQPERSYQLKVRLSSGAEYESTMERLTTAPPIESLRAQLNGTVVDFYIDFTDNSEEENYYRWRYRGSYEVIAPVAYDMSRTNQQMPRTDCIAWDGPRPYAKDIYRCWVREGDPEYLMVESDEFFNGRSMRDFKLATMELTQKFDKGYNFELEQHTLTRGAYTYWRAIMDQMGNTGTIFETSNYQIKGNISSSSNPNELVLGYFSVSGVQTQTLFVGDFMGLFGDVPCEKNNSGCYPERCMDCRRFAANATTVKPVNWPL